MLKSITLRDFFSFRGEHTIELRPGVNLLLGINGSGKTSFINALRLLYEGVAGGGVSKLIQEQWGGFDQIVNSNGKETASYAQLEYVFESGVHYKITIRKSGTSYILSEMIKDGAKVYETPETDKEQEAILWLLLKEARLDVLCKTIESMSVYSNFDVGEGSALRRPVGFSIDTRLRKSGENLTQILNDLKLNHTFDFERLEETLHNVNPNFKSIDIANLYGQAYLFLREKNMSRTIGALHISDGTLRFLLLESIFYNPLRGNLVAIDEPERGLHPDMIRSVAEMMKQATAQTQIIVATHSPHLLNQFELEDVLIFEKDETNSTVVRTVSEDDFPDWEGEFLPGQMWLCGQIGGKRW